MMDWNIIVISLCTLLLLSLLFKEWTRSDQRYRLTRIVATAIAISSLAFLAIPITTTKYKQKRSAVLVTPGFDADSVERLVRRSGGQTAVYRLPGVQAPVSLNPVLLPYSTQLDDTLAGFDTTHIFGHGLQKHQYAQLTAGHYIFHDSKTSTGFRKVIWQQQLQQGQELEVHGSIHSSDTNALSVLLYGPGRVADSAVADSKNKFTFSLRQLPGQLGRYVYTLLLVSGNDTIAREPLPVEVLETKQRSVLMLSAFPDFESRFLKNWLSGNGFQVAQRTTISKNKFDQQFINMKPVALQRLSASLLDRFDVVVLDHASLRSMSRQELQVLQNHSSAKGIGIVVRTSLTNKENTLMQDFEIQPAGNAVKRTLKLAFAQDIDALPDLSVDELSVIRQSEQFRPIISDKNGLIVAAVKAAGRGRVVVTTIQNSYHWMLSGESNAYQHYWSALLENALPESPDSWQLDVSKPRLHQPVRIYYSSATDSVPFLFANETRLAVRQIPFSPNTWEANWWPSEAGWNLLSNGANDSMWTYVYADEQWKTEMIHQVKEDSKSVHFISSEQSGENKMATATHLSKLYFFIPFILSLGFLWYEKKRSSST